LGLNWPGTDPVSRAAFATTTPNRARLRFFAWSATAASFFLVAGLVLIAQHPSNNPLRALVAFGVLPF
jgi:hypothetical protein